MSTNVHNDPIAYRRNAVRSAAAILSAVEDDRIAGLWHAPGYPELTTGQLLQVAGDRARATLGV